MLAVRLQLLNQMNLVYGQLIEDVLANYAFLRKSCLLAMRSNRDPAAQEIYTYAIQ